MKKFIIIIYCLILNIGVYGITYSSYTPINLNNNQTNSTPYQTNFKSTGVTYQITPYNTVLPLNNDGTVSIDYTTGKYMTYTLYGSRGLDLDDDDEPTGGMVPIGNIPYEILLLFVIIMIFTKYEKIKNG